MKVILTLITLIISLYAKIEFLNPSNIKDIKFLNDNEVAIVFENNLFQIVDIDKEIILENYNLRHSNSNERQAEIIIYKDNLFVKKYDNYKSEANFFYIDRKNSKVIRVFDKKRKIYEYFFKYNKLFYETKINDFNNAIGYVDLNNYQDKILSTYWFRNIRDINVLKSLIPEYAEEFEYELNKPDIKKDNYNLPDKKVVAHTKNYENLILATGKNRIYQLFLNKDGYKILNFPKQKDINRRDFNFFTSSNSRFTFIIEESLIDYSSNRNIYQNKNTNFKLDFIIKTFKDKDNKEKQSVNTVLVDENKTISLYKNEHFTNYFLNKNIRPYTLIDKIANIFIGDEYIVINHKSASMEWESNTSIKLFDIKKSKILKSFTSNSIETLELYQDNIVYISMPNTDLLEIDLNSGQHKYYKDNFGQVVAIKATKDKLQTLSKNGFIAEYDLSSTEEVK